MTEQFLLYLGMILTIVMIIMLADKIRVAYPVLLVIAGLVVSVIPGMPVIHINPELIFVIFLPPLLFDAAFAISWKELWRWRRIVGSFAFVVVFITAWSVALASSAWIPGITLTLGFLLGGIISPPDAVSASAILKFVKVPRRMSSILEGESLLNDASSLIIFRFATIAVITGHFVWYEAALSFGWMVIGGVGIGLIIAWLFMKAHKLLPTDANIDIVLNLVAPYIMYIVAEEAHSSGVLSVVSGGLLLSYRRHEFLSSSSRLRGANVWQSLVFILNGLVFLLIGLDMPEILTGLKQDGIGVPEAIGYGLLITAVLILMRFLAAYGAVITTLIMRNFINVADPNPGFKAPFMMGWTGMRGVVSLAAALSIPLESAAGVPFPQRNLILFITFVVIVTTLLVQGLTLPYLIKAVKFRDYGDYLPDEEADKILQRGMVKHALDHINTNYKEQLESHPSFQLIQSKWQSKEKAIDTDPQESEEVKSLHLAILNQQREWLLDKSRTEAHIDDEVIRKLLRQIDLEEEKLKS